MDGDKPAAIFNEIFESRLHRLGPAFAVVVRDDDVMRGEVGFPRGPSRSASSLVGGDLGFPLLHLGRKLRLGGLVWILRGARCFRGRSGSSRDGHLEASRFLEQGDHDGSGLLPGVVVLPVDEEHLDLIRRGERQTKRKSGGKEEGKRSAFHGKART